MVLLSSSFNNLLAKHRTAETFGIDQI